MRTLGQATNIQQTTLGSTGASLQTSRVAAQQNVAGNSLANDIMGIVGKTGQVAQEVNTLSVKAAQRVASDNKTSLAFRLNEIDRETNYNDPQSIREAQMANELAYQENGRKTFDNEDAQIAYDDGYHKSAAIGVASTNTKLEKKALILDANNLYANSVAGLNEQLKAGIPFDTTEMNSMVGAMTAGDYHKKENAQLSLAGESTTAFSTKVMGSLSDVLISSGYNAETGITKDVLSNVFDKNFGAFGTIGEKGNIEWVDGLESKAQNEILGKWKSFTKSVSGLTENDVNIALQNYKIARSENNKQVINGKTLPHDIDANNKKLYKMANDLSNLSKSESNKIYNDIKTGQEQLHKATNVQTALDATSAQIKGFTSSGVQYFDNEGIEQTASGEYVTNQIKAQQEVYSDNITSKPVGSEEYNNAASKAIMLEYKTGIKNPVIDNYVKGITGTGIMIGVDEVDKSIDIAGKMRTTGTANSMLKNTAYLAMAQQLQAQHKAGKLTDEEYVLQTNKKLEQMRISTFSRIESGAFKTSWKTAIGEAQDMWFKNTAIDLRTADALLIKYAAEGGSPTVTDKDMVNYIKANVVEFAGSFTGSANSLGGFFTDSVSDSSSALRMTDSEGIQLDDYAYEDGMENIVKQYNQNNPESKISVSDLRVVSPYDAKAGKDEIVWSVSIMKNGNDIPLNDYTGDEMIKMAGWKTEANSLTSSNYDKRLEALKKNQKIAEDKQITKDAIAAAKENPVGETSAAEKTPMQLDNYNYNAFDDSDDVDTSTGMRSKTIYTAREMSAMDEAGIRAVQESNGLEVTGKWDKKTQDMIDKSEKVELPDDEFNPDDTIQYSLEDLANMSEDEIKTMQKKNGFKVTGVFRDSIQKMVDERNQSMLDEIFSYEGTEQIPIQLDDYNYNRFEIKPTTETGEPLSAIDVSTLDDSEVRSLQKKIGVDVNGKFGVKSKRALENYDNNKAIAAKIDGMDTAQVNRLIEQESSGGSYTTQNQMKGSTAYGRYQFIQSTAYPIAKAVGYKGENNMEELKKFMTPEKQDEMFIELTNRNVKRIKQLNERTGFDIPINTFTLYGAHQLGADGINNVLTKTASGLSSREFNNMANNLGFSKAQKDDLKKQYNNKDVVAMVRDAWLQRYGKLGA